MLQHFLSSAALGACCRACASNRRWRSRMMKLAQQLDQPNVEGRSGRNVAQGSDY